MKTPSDRPAIPAEMLQKLHAVQRRERQVTLQTGLLRAAAVLLAAMLAMLLLDWIAVPHGGPWRWLMTLAALSCGVAALIVFCLRPLLRPRSLDSVAQQVDLAHPSLEERCQTLTEFSRSEDNPEIRGSEAMIQKLAQQTAAMSGSVVPHSIVSRSGLLQAVKFFGAAAAVMALLFLLDFQEARVLCERFFEPGADITLTQVRANTGDLDVAKGENVTLEFTTTGKATGAASLSVLTKDGRKEEVDLQKDDKASTKAAAHYVYTAKSATDSFDYFARSGDGQTALHHVNVLERPALSQVELRILAPAYSKLPDIDQKTLPRQVRALEGSKMELSFQADQPLASMDLKFADGKTQRLTETADHRYHFDTTLTNTFAFEPVMMGVHHLDNSVRPNVKVIVYPDLPPTVNVTSPSDDITARPNDTIKIEFEARDDFGLTKAELVVNVNNDDGSNSAPIVFPIPLDAKEQGAKLIQKSVDLDLSQFNLKQDQELTYSIRVTDTKNGAAYSNPGPDREQSQPITPSNLAMAQNQNSQPNAAQNPSQQNGAQNPSQQNNAQNSAPQNNAGNPSQPNIARNSSPQNDAQNPAQPNSAQSSSQQQNSSQQPSGQNSSPQNTAQNSSQPQNSSPQTGSQNPSQSNTAQTSSPQSGGQNPAQQNSAQNSSQPQNSSAQNGGQNSASQNDAQNSSPQNTAQNSSPQNSAQNASRPNSVRMSSSQNSAQNQGGQQNSSQNSASSQPQANSSDNQNTASTQTPNPADSQNHIPMPPGKPSDSNPSSPSGSQPPPNNMAKRVLDAGGQTSSGQPMRVKVDEWARSFDAQSREKQETAIDPTLKHLDELLHKAHDLTESTLAAAKSTTGLGPDQSPAMEDDKDQIRQATRAIGDLKKLSAGTPYAFIGLQVADIGDTHISPAGEELGEVALEPAKAKDDRNNLELASAHITEARKMLADLTKSYESVKRDNQLADAMQELKKMHQIFLEDTQAMLGGKKPPINSVNRKVAEVDDDYVTQLNKLLEEQKKIMAELAKILANDPRMLRRFMALAELDGTTLRDQMTLLAQRQDALTKQTAQWAVADQEARPALASQFLTAQAGEQTDIAALAGKLHENMITWLPDGLSQDEEPVATAFKIAAEGYRLAAEASAQTSPDTLTNGLLTARKALDQFRLLHDYLPEMSNGGGDSKDLSVFSANRLNEAADLVTRESGWIKKMESLRSGDYTHAAEVDQHSVELDTTTLSEKIDAAAPTIENLSPEIHAKSDELIHTVHKQILPDEGRATDALSRNLVKDAVPRQEGASKDFALAEKQFDELLRLIVAKLDAAPPPSSPGQNQTLDEMLAMLKEEKKAAETLGIPNRPINVQVMKDWMQPSSSQSQQASSGQARQQQARAAQQRARDAARRANRLTDQARITAQKREVELSSKEGDGVTIGPKPPANSWNTIASQLGDELRQSRDNVPPEQYRQAIEQYFSTISETVPAPPAPDKK